MGQDNVPHRQDPMRPHERTDSDWLGEFKAYLEQHDRMPRLRTHPDATDQDLRLTAWLNRIQYKDAETPERKRVRDEVIAIKSARDPWSTHFAALRAFSATHGRMPGRGDGITLSHWVADQRSAYRRGSLPADRADKLRTIPGALPEAPLTAAEVAEEVWNGFFADLQEWTKKNGRTPRRRSTDPDEYRLANWLNRQLVNHRAGKLSAAWTRKLRRAGALPA